MKPITSIRAVEPRQCVPFLTAVCAAVLYALPAMAGRAIEDEPRGKLVYSLHCARCHGPTGLGDGPRADELNVRPTNFQDPVFQSRSDEQALRGIEFGEVRSPMHAWRDRLTAEEIREVLVYIRALGHGGHSEERP